MGTEKKQNIYIEKGETVQSANLNQPSNGIFNSSEPTNYGFRNVTIEQEEQNTQNVTEIHKDESKHTNGRTESPSTKNENQSENIKINIEAKKNEDITEENGGNYQAFAKDCGSRFTNIKVRL